MELNQQICNRAITHIQELVVPATLNYAFIAGSRASGSSRPDSDIDYFVVLNHPSRCEEISIAQSMLHIHEEFSLRHTHCGEILSLPTLDKMLSLIPDLRFLIDRGYLECPCFGADCILSIARKLLVVLHMLAGPKSHVVGDVTTLEQHAMRAKQFFATVPEFRIKKSSDLLDWSGMPQDGSRLLDWHRFTDMIQAGEFIDTPVGVGLERWFDRTTIFRGIEHPVNNLGAIRIGAITPNKCTLEQLPRQQGLASVIEAQCISP